MSKITEEYIDKVFLEATQNNLMNITEQFVEAVEKMPECKNNSLAREVLAVSIAQGNIMAAMKEVCYELFLDND